MLSCWPGRTHAFSCCTTRGNRQALPSASCATTTCRAPGSSPVGYLEGIFVREDCRRQGYARELLASCQAWAAAQGCREFASDCELTNQESYRFHLATGFGEAGRIICFVKELSPSPQEKE